MGCITIELRSNHGMGEPLVLEIPVPDTPDRTLDKPWPQIDPPYPACKQILYCSCRLDLTYRLHNYGLTPWRKPAFPVWKTPCMTAWTTIRISAAYAGDTARRISSRSRWTIRSSGCAAGRTTCWSRPESWRSGRSLPQPNTCTSVQQTQPILHSGTASCLTQTSRTCTGGFYAWQSTANPFTF